MVKSNKSSKGFKAVVVAVLMGLSVLLSACGDGDGNGVGDSADLLRKVECDISKMADGGGLGICK